MNPDWDGIMKARAREHKTPQVPPLVIDRTSQRVRILRIALEAIYGTPELTLAEARQIAHKALEDTD